MGWTIQPAGTVVAMRPWDQTAASCPHLGAPASIFSFASSLSQATTYSSHVRRSQGVAVRGVLLGAVRRRWGSSRSLTGAAGAGGEGGRRGGGHLAAWGMHARRERRRRLGP